jgi:SAM-dependent methyltransferase
MDYFKENKEAWEEAFIKHQIARENDPIENKFKKDLEFLNDNLINEIKSFNLKDKDIAQFCCNNGRELLSIVKYGAKSGTGFDISENFINEANRISKLKNINCNFICTNILTINNQYKEKYDFVFSTIGTICWFDNLKNFFSKVNLVLKTNGMFLISEQHPLTNCIAMEKEDEYDINNPEKIVYSYFRKEPWIENKGMDYVGNTKYKSKTFTSFSHTFSDIINAMTQNNIQIVEIKEFNQSLHDFNLLNNGKLPLSMLIIGKKNAT